MKKYKVSRNTIEWNIGTIIRSLPLYKGSELKDRLELLQKRLLSKSPIKEKKVWKTKFNFNPKFTPLIIKNGYADGGGLGVTPTQSFDNKVPKEVSLEIFCGDYSTPQQTYELAIKINEVLTYLSAIK